LAARVHAWRKCWSNPWPSAIAGARELSDGTSRDITSLAVYEPVNGLVKVSHDGLVNAGPGETTVLVRYLVPGTGQAGFHAGTTGFKTTGQSAIILTNTSLPGCTPCA
jgi:hypothetical protein